MDRYFILFSFTIIRNSKLLLSQDFRSVNTEKRFYGRHYVNVNSCNVAVSKMFALMASADYIMALKYYRTIAD